MRKAWLLLGRLLFWLTWPTLWLILNKSKRTRVLLVHGDKILVVRSWLSDGRWCLPGGGMHAQETALESAIREIDEEVGLKLTPDTLQPLLHETLRDHGIATELHYFVGRIERDMPLIRRRLEISEAAWLKPTDLTLTNAKPDTLHAIAAWRAARRI